MRRLWLPEQSLHWKGVLILLVGVMLVALGFFGVGLDLRTADVGNGTDFWQDYCAAQALRRGASIYDSKCGNGHTPFDVLPFWLLARLPVKTAFLVWSALSLVFLGVTLAIVLLGSASRCGCRGWSCLRVLCCAGIRFTSI